MSHIACGSDTSSFIHVSFTSFQVSRWSVKLARGALLDTLEIKSFTHAMYVFLSHSSALLPAISHTTH